MEREGSEEGVEEAIEAVEEEEDNGVREAVEGEAIRAKAIISMKEAIGVDMMQGSITAHKTKVDTRREVEEGIGESLSQLHSQTAIDSSLEAINQPCFKTLFSLNSNSFSVNLFNFMEEGGDVIRAGWLERYKNIIKRNSKRYYELKPPFLEYRGKPEGRLHGIYELADSKIEAHVKKPKVFILKLSNGKVMNMKAESPEEARLWIQDLLKIQ